MTFKLTYRTARQSDIHFLLDLRRKTMDVHLLASSLSISKKSHLQRIEYKFEHALIIEFNKTAIGLLKIEKTPSSIELIQIQIDPLYQGKGIGRQLLNHIIAESVNLGKTITLSVLKSNLAKNLYLDLGFKVIGEDDHSYSMKFLNKSQSISSAK